MTIRCASLRHRPTNLQGQQAAPFGVDFAVFAKPGGTAGFVHVKGQPAGFLAAAAAAAASAVRLRPGGRGEGGRKPAPPPVARQVGDLAAGAVAASGRGGQGAAQGAGDRFHPSNHGAELLSSRRDAARVMPKAGQNSQRSAIVQATPATTVPSRLRVFTATKKAARAAAISSVGPAFGLSPAMNSDCAIRAAMTATGTCFSQSAAAFGSWNRLSTMSGSTRGSRVTNPEARMA